MFTFYDFPPPTNKMKTESIAITPRLMTRDYAIREGFISPVDGQINEERKYPYVRITHWYAHEEHWMLNNAANALSGCDFIVIVEETSQAVFRSTHQIQLSDGE